MNKLQLVECPRDAMQGWSAPIDTAQKVDYLNALLRVGFHTLDFGSFVSPKAIPQMADTRQVVEQLDWAASRTRLLAIVANLRGAEEALEHDGVAFLGFPFSVSPTFQQRNTNSTPEESLKRVDEIQELCLRRDRQLVIYLSMGFGNPYGDPYDSGILQSWAAAMAERGITILSLADTVGLATPEQISTALETLIPQFPGTTIGVHLHAQAGNLRPKLAAALAAGCQRFDGALKGIGGCPMAGDGLVGNMNTEEMIDFFEEKGLPLDLDRQALDHCLELAAKIFPS